jgi:hypothetical protein
MGEDVPELIHHDGLSACFWCAARATFEEGWRVIEFKEIP